MKKLAAALGMLTALALAGFVALTGERPLAVRSVEVALGDVADALTTNGRIEAGEQVGVHAEVEGRIVRVAVEAGDAVERGQLLVAIDRAEADAAVRRAEARLDAARAELSALVRGLSPAERADIENEIAGLRAREAKLTEDLQTTRRLVERAAAPREEARRLERDLDEARRLRSGAEAKLERRPSVEERAAAEARLREAEGDLAAARRRAALAEVRAPAAGRVYSLAVRPGDYAQPGSPLAQIASSPAARAVVFVDEPELAKVRVGQVARLTADGLPGRTWPCRIDRAPTEIVERGTRRVGEARCVVESESADLLPNLTVGVSIPIASATAVATAPREAVARAGGADFVWVADQTGRARRRPVVLGVRGDTRVEVLSGAAVGDRLLLPGDAGLTDGRLVAAEE